MTGKSNLKNWNSFLDWYEKDSKKYLSEIKEVMTIAEEKREDFIKKWPREELKNLQFDELATGSKGHRNIFLDLAKDDFLMSIGASLSKSRIKYIEDEPKVCLKTKGIVKNSDFTSSYHISEIAMDLSNKVEQFLRGDFEDKGNFFDGNHYSTILIKLTCMYAKDNDVFIPDNNISKESKGFIKPLLQEFGMKLSENHYEANHQILKLITKRYPDLKNSWIFSILKYRFLESPSELEDSKREEITLREGKENQMMRSLTSVNTILFGPPGTGKTYHSIMYAVDTIDHTFFKSGIGYKDYLKEFNRLKESGQIAFITFHQSYGYEEFIEGIKPEVNDGQVSYQVESGSFKSFCEKASQDLDKKFVFIIDEINRGNISKIFGELITLIEDSKRAGSKEAMAAKLVYSKEIFSVPKNVYILGTMNTADRSIAMMDTALRRRFEFIEMMPDTDDSSSPLKDIRVGKINILSMLKAMNKRIEVLYDREHTLGHAFFMPLKDSQDLTTLCRIFQNKIIPLLQEYFYEDYEKIMTVLGIEKDNIEDSRFISKEVCEDEFLSRFSEELVSFRINNKAFLEEKNYLSIYSKVNLDKQEGE